MWNSLPGVLIVCLTVGWVLTTWIRAKYGYPIEDRFDGSAHRRRRKESRKVHDSHVAERDAKIAKLEERVRVLERLVTRRSDLEDELDRLRT